MVTEEKGYFSLRTAARGMGATTGELTAEADVQPHMERAALEVEPEGHLAIGSEMVATAPGIM